MKVKMLCSDSGTTIMAIHGVLHDIIVIIIIRSNYRRKCVAADDV